VELISSAYVTSTAEAMNSTWFQIATDAGFTNLKIDRIRDVETLYGDTGAPLFEPVNTTAGVDILRLEVAAGLANGNYHARVRHRDENTLWSPWSDAVSFTIEGSTAGDPKITLQKTVYAPNEDILIAYENGPGIATDWIGIYRKGQTPGDLQSTTWQYVVGGNGTRNFTFNLPVGEWFAAFFTADGYTEIAPRVPFYVGNLVTLAPAKESHEEGETATFAYSGAPGGAADWVGIYRTGTSPGTSTPSVMWSYAPAVSGSLPFAALPKGYYYAVFMVDDGYQEISARVPFSVGSLISSITMESTEVQAGDDFTVSFSDGPGIPKDWIGIFKEGETPGVDVLTAYLYFDGATSGSVTFELPNLSAGNYFAAMFTNDSYTEVSNRIAFTVMGKPPLEFEQADLQGNEMRLRWKSEPGKTYKVQKSTGLGGWTDVRTVTASGPVHEELIPVDRVADPKCFFRVTDD
jgi:acid phosphatase type 7